MTRRQKQPRRKKRSGVLMGMRSGVQKVAGAVTGGKDKSDEVVKSPRSKAWTVISNVVSAVLIVAAVAVLLRRCGVIKF